MLEVSGLLVTRGAPGHGWRVSLPRLHLARGEVMAITGSSGCGKSTLLEALGLILQPDQVQRYALGDTPGIDVAALLSSGQQAALADIRARHLGFVLQTGGLLPFLSVRQNIALPRRMLRLPVDDEMVEEAIAVLGLQALLDKKPAQLSIGERQRAAFVRAIAHRPALLLADEPTAALDPLQAERLFHLMIDLVQRFRIAGLIVSHDWRLVEACGLRRVQASTDTQGAVFHVPD